MKKILRLLNFPILSRSNLPLSGSMKSPPATRKKWGVDRLIHLVDQGPRRAVSRATRFAQSCARTSRRARCHFTCGSVGSRLAALNAAAESRGCARIDSAAWEVVTPAGRKIAFVSDIRAYKALKRDGWEIWSAEEVGRIIDKFSCRDRLECFRGGAPKPSGYFPARKLPACGQRPRLMMRYRFEAQAKG